MTIGGGVAEPETTTSRPGSADDAATRFVAPAPGSPEGADPAEPSDGELAKRVAAGDREAAGVLVERYQRQVRRFLGRLVNRADQADDLAQETFVRMLRYADRYDPKYPMRTWLMTIARRLSINAAAKNKRVILGDEFDHNPSPHGSHETDVDRADHNRLLARRLQAAITELSEPQRQAIVLFHQQDLNVQEVAAVMGVPVGTVKSHLHRGRLAMRKILAPDPEVNPQ